ncbi:acyltransferase [Chromobacterium sp. IIBBL 290-4]|uniref:acyltransferase family protein n=1 Tax=Chromobacterium sp. IIBBL 290-4 TaxID=2953890 RepID=UPI0020B8090C|nr:acyltransferase [Chromobacterium sp. IIBBL 290-4]UTH73787.1 acyltransferase [Chromobacterium sp. IIBBL 290-4]
MGTITLASRVMGNGPCLISNLIKNLFMIVVHACAPEVPLVAKGRIAGLDTLRALAIVLVLCTHYAVVVSREPTFGYFTRWGWAGVDLFFVLSGYLIGSQIMAPLATGQVFSWRNFMARRFLRTLPNYYVILALYLLLGQTLGGSTTASVWQFLTFTQNFSFLQWNHTFSHSWSLCIEEQFYLALPLALLLAWRMPRPVLAMWVLAVLAIAGGMLARAICWQRLGADAYGAPFYYSSFTRFDELLPGVLIALLQHFHPKAFAKMAKQSIWLLISGAGLVILGLLWIGNQIPTTMPSAILAYPMLAWGFALVMFSCLQPSSLLNQLMIPGAGQLAAWSYAIYLAHKPVFKLVLAPLQNAGVSPKSNLGIMLIMSAGIGAGWVLFRLVETPFMNARARWFPSGVKA